VTTLAHRSVPPSARRPRCSGPPTCRPNPPPSITGAVPCHVERLRPLKRRSGLRRRPCHIAAPRAGRLPASVGDGRHDPPPHVHPRSHLEAARRRPRRRGRRRGQCFAVGRGVRETAAGGNGRRAARAAARGGRAPGAGGRRGRRGAGGRGARARRPHARRCARRRRGAAPAGPRRGAGGQRTPLRPRRSLGRRSVGHWERHALTGTLGSGIAASAWTKNRNAQQRQLRGTRCRVERNAQY